MQKLIPLISSTKQMDKKGLNKLLAQIYLEFGGAKTAELADTLKI